MFGVGVKTIIARWKASLSTPKYGSLPGPQRRLGGKIFFSKMPKKDDATISFSHLVAE